MNSATLVHKPMSYGNVLRDEGVSSWRGTSVATQCLT
jgi:hypothetical protein